MLAVCSYEYSNPKHEFQPLYESSVIDDLLLYLAEPLNSEEFTPQELSEEKMLVQAAQQGDRTALGNLFAKYERKLQHFLRKRVANAEDVSDLLQDTFLQAHLNITKFQSSARFSTWLVGISLNIVRNFYNRAPQNRYDFVNDEGVIDRLAGSYAPERLVAWDQCAMELGARFSNIDEKYREVMERIAFSGLSYEEAAVALGISVPAIKSRLFRARQMMRVQSVDEILEANAE